MGGVRDGVVPTVFGSLLADGLYDAYAGEAEFRGDKLVRIEFRHFHGADPDGLTVGFTIFPHLDPGSVSAAREGDGEGFFRARGVNRVYAGGALVAEVELGQVLARPAHAD